jgi:hypothetical protein
MGVIRHERGAVCTIREPWVVMWEAYVIVWKLMPRVRAVCIRREPCGAVWESYAIWAPYFPAWESCATPYDAIYSILNCMGATQLAPRARKQGYIGFYRRGLSATLGATVAKERRCGACRRLVCTSRRTPMSAFTVKWIVRDLCTFLEVIGTAKTGGNCSSKARAHHDRS